MKKRIDYSVEVETLEEIVLSTPLTRSNYEFEIRRLTLQCGDTAVCDTVTELVETDTYETPTRIVHNITFLRGTTFITFIKTEWKGSSKND